MSVKIQIGMSLADAALASAGSIEDLFSFARLNGFAITDTPQPGQELTGTGIVYRPSGTPSVAYLMVKQVPVMEGQTIADLAIQQLGSIEALFDLAKLNGFGVTNVLFSGQLLDYSLTPVDQAVLKTYTDNGYKPASATTVAGQGQPDQLTGIDYWIIESDFIVS